jgi:hypothetical protein
MYLPSAALLNGIMVEGRSGNRKSSGVIDPLVAQLIALGIGRGTIRVVASDLPNVTRFNVDTDL